MANKKPRFTENESVTSLLLKRKGLSRQKKNLKLRKTANWSKI